MVKRNLTKKTPKIRVRQLNCVRTEIYPLSRELLGDNPERLFLGKLRSGSIPDLSFSTLVA